MKKRRNAKTKGSTIQRSTGGSSITAVAQRAGVSIATVSRVMHGNTSKVSAKTRDRVRRVIDALDYRPSSVGSALRSGRNHLVALLIPDVESAVFATIATSIGDALQSTGKQLVLGNTRDKPSVQDDLIEQMQSQLVSGIVFVGAVHSPKLTRCLAQGDPIVLVGRHINGSPPGFFVGIDNQKGGSDVGDLFSRRRFRNVWIVHGPFKSRSTEQRTKGFLAAMKRNGCPAKISRFEIPDSRMETSYAFARKHLNRNTQAEAIFCTTDEIAFGIFKRCREIGISVPQDIFLFGFDGNPVGGFIAPWLSTVRVPYEMYGEAVVEVLQRQWENKHGLKDIVLPHEIIDGRN